MKKKFILCLGGGVYQKHLVEEIKKINCEPIVVDADNSCVCFNEVQFKINLNINETELILNKIKNLNIRKNIIAVVTQAARTAPRQASFLAKKLKCESLNFRTAKLLEDKYKISKIFNKLLNPKKFKNQFILKKRAFPYLIKINNLSGGRGIFKINKKSDVKNFLKKNKYSNFFAENYKKSKSFNIVGLKLKNRVKFYGIFEKKINKNFSTSNIFYSKENFDKRLHLLNFCKKVLTKIKFDHGPFNFELFEDQKKKLFVAEIEPSLIGGNVAKYLCNEASNQNIIKDYLSFYLNKNINFKTIFKKKYLSIDYFYSKQSYQNFLSIIRYYKINPQIKKIDFLKYKKKGLAKYLLFSNFRNRENFNKYLNIINY